MRNVKNYWWMSFLALHAVISTVLVEAAESNPTTPATPAAKPFSPFTGRVTKNKVRMRLQPNFDSTVIKELARDELIVVQGESDEFYVIDPPSDTKGYVFRTFVLDNVIEGNRVNVRLEPNTDAPVISQLNTGDHIEGVISSINSKWLEIQPPSSTRFFVAKEYVEKVGDPSMMATIARRREDVNKLLNDAYTKSSQELAKPYEKIPHDDIVWGYKKVIKDYPEFTDQVERAKELLSSYEDSYLRKKVAYLESKTKQMHQEMVAAATTTIPATTQAHANTDPVITKSVGPSPEIVHEVTSKMTAWIPAENSQYEIWAAQHESKTMQDFYDNEKLSANSLQGILEYYHSTVKNKPGDYVLVNQTTHLPIAYLYSTQVNLDPFVGREVSVHASSRPNRQFAFPAYYVLSVE